MGTTEQLREQNLATIIFNQIKEDPNALGEALLKYSFVGEGRGCYSNFILRSSFRKYSEGVDIFADHLIGYFPPELWDAEYYADKDNIQSYIDPEMDLAVLWFWDGDGHLIFKLGDIIIENTDIKKSYYWKFL